MKLSHLISTISLSLALNIAAADTPAPASRHAFSIDTGKGVLSGIMLVRGDSAGLTGSLINEFGFSALDFRYTTDNRKLRLLNVISFLDRWYMKRTLSADLGHCLDAIFDPRDEAPRGYSISRSNDTLTVVNLRRRINYQFSPLSQ